MKPHVQSFFEVLLGLVSWVAAVACAAERDVVINEIMYNPPEDRDDLQYLELFNRGAAPVDLSGWSFAKGIKFELPPTTILSPGAYLVICRNRAAFASHYGAGPSALGDFSGKLSHKGEQIELVNGRRETIDQVEYSDHAPWPAGPDGYSASLERICPAAPADQPANWAGSVLPEVETSGGTPGRRNDSFSDNLPPIVSSLDFRPPPPDRPGTVTAEIADPDGVTKVELLVSAVRSQDRSTEAALGMSRTSGNEKQGRYQAIIQGFPQDTLVRFRIKSVDSTGAIRYHPDVNEPHPTFSYFVGLNTNTARIAFSYLIEAPFQPAAIVPSAQPPARPPRPTGRAAEPARGNGVFLHAAPASTEVHVFDHVQIRRRKGGLKVHFQKDRPFKGITGINLIYEGPPRWVLAEPLAYELYRLAGVPAPHAEHVRLWHNGRLRGYQLLVEQPNKAFLERHGRDDSGDLYKLIWQGRDLVAQHEKKTNPSSGHDQLITLIRGLEQTHGAEQWEFIQRHFNVDEFLAYYAVNMCIQNWDGFWNNYFAYHDLGSTGKWEIYPWDEDKTWGDYDGSARRHDWYEMPLTMGMAGDQPTGGPFWGRWAGGRQGFAPNHWWRPPGWFSGPMLANPEFRQHFLRRLDELCATAFTENKLLPVIDRMEQDLEPEIQLTADVTRRNPQAALNQFHEDMQSFRNQVKYRRQFILREIPNAEHPVRSALMTWLLRWLLALSGVGGVLGGCWLILRRRRPRKLA